MKRMILTFIIAACAAALYGQKDNLDSFFDKYSDKSGYTVVTINGNLFGLLKEFDDDADLEGLDGKVSGIRLIARDHKDAPAGSSLISEVTNAIKGQNYEELMTVKEHDSDLLFMVKSEGASIKEILIVASGEEEAVIQIRGNFTREDAYRMTEKENDRIGILESLESSGK